MVGHEARSLSRLSDLTLVVAGVAELAHVRDGHYCLAHSFSSFFNTSDSLCPLGTLYLRVSNSMLTKALTEIAKHMTKIPLNVSLIRKEFEVFHYVPNCPSLLGRQICDLCQGYNRLAQLIAERSKQEPLPPIEPTTRNPNDVHLAYVILVHRSDFLLTTSVESVCFSYLFRTLTHFSSRN